MSQYSIEFSRAAKKAIAQLDPPIKARVEAVIHMLSLDPHPPSSRRLSGTNKFRVRTGDYRIIYSISDKVVTITILDVGHRRDVYRKL